MSTGWYGLNNEQRTVMNTAWYGLNNEQRNVTNDDWYGLNNEQRNVTNTGWYGLNNEQRHSARGKKTRQTEEEVGRQHQGMDGSGVRQDPEGSGEQIYFLNVGNSWCNVQTTLAVRG